ncbi:undecaprenyl-diphosphate phosphatase [Chryseosolibacter indicus]|uniref:Undecaprenyl-diphosphatase n=1 Tax=Chryseosolibacter indicus TaxID=2782351 RepID=A0ABS5VXJ2_9BACT|nr:undecaprenyl-diphosphate phosphatase [Chryseosolibacter indicus]MBT1706137.1 undecaprenyl-diphosphate phosphatase [Chryseosolibacter indicus]
MSVIEAIILAIIEGITEFLPISSTGHMIIGSSLMGIAQHPFTKMFTVAIQLGAILSVVVLYWKRFFQSFEFYFKLFVAFIPAVIGGLLFKDYIDALLERVDVVGYMLLIGGIFFLFMDKIFASDRVTEEEITYSKAFKIGMFQIIAMVPGVSRSAATIIGGLSQKLNKKTAAEFSFFLAVPTMFAATVLSIYEFFNDGGSFGEQEITALIIGNVVAFVVAMIAIKSFIAFLTKHGFKVFGYYRIVVGIAILIMYYMGLELSIV